jgi:UDP-N-acetylmuramate dehydrogenase
MCISDSRVFRLSQKELEFGERSSFFKKDHDLLILEAEFKLFRDEPESILDEMRLYFLERRRKQPYNSPSAGCIFRRDGDILPGRLIEEAGMKGSRRGGAEVSRLHANFIININANNALSSDIWLLKEEIIQTVYKEFGFRLKTEVEFLGDFG